MVASAPRPYPTQESGRQSLDMLIPQTSTEVYFCQAPYSHRDHFFQILPKDTWLVRFEVQRPRREKIVVSRAPSPPLPGTSS